jgi:hypothetical protein
MPEVLVEERPRRRTLGEELDRLDAILDVMADGLKEAVADASREGARAVAREVLVEVLTDPGLRALVAATGSPRREPNPRPPRGPDLRVRAFAALDAARVGLGRGVKAALDRVAGRYRGVRAAADALAGLASPPFPARRIGALSLGAGLVAALGGLLAPSAASIVLGGLGAMCAAAAVQLALWLSGPVDRPAPAEQKPAAGEAGPS